MTTTSDETALLVVIVAHPDEDTPRLMYADFLDERAEPGDAVRAEFIRLQCELAGLEHQVCRYECRSRQDYRCRYCVLSDRETALRAAHEADWRRAGPCPKCYRKVNLVTGKQTPMGCNSCDGTGDVGMLCGRGNVLLLSNPPKPGPFRHPVQLRRGFIEQIDATLGDVFEYHVHSLSTDGRMSTMGDWVPTARALAWVREFRTCQRVRLVDRTPGRDSGDQRGRYRDKETFDWWDAGVMSNGDLGREPDYLPSIIHAKIRELYPESVVQPAPEEAIYGLTEFDTAEAAHDALARTVAAVLRGHKG